MPVSKLSLQLAVIKSHHSAASASMDMCELRPRYSGQKAEFYISMEMVHLQMW